MQISASQTYGGGNYYAGAMSFGIQVPALIGFSYQPLLGKIILDSGATCSMGAVDLLTYVQEQFYKNGIVLNTRKAQNLTFSFANGTEDTSTETFPIPIIDMRMVLSFRVLNAPGPILLGEDAHESLKLVIDHETGEVWSKTLHRGFKAEKLGSGHLVIDVCNEDSLRVLSVPDFKADLVNALERDHQGFGVDCVQYKESMHTSTQAQYEHHKEK